jgi:hypothetical protein
MSYDEIIGTLLAEVDASEDRPVEDEEEAR